MFVYILFGRKKSRPQNLRMNWEPTFMYFIKLMENISKGTKIVSFFNSKLIQLTKQSRIKCDIKS